jgi:hypothetical protein
VGSSCCTLVACSEKCRRLHTGLIYVEILDYATDEHGSDKAACLTPLRNVWYGLDYPHCAFRWTSDFLHGCSPETSHQGKSVYGVQASSRRLSRLPVHLPLTRRSLPLKMMFPLHRFLDLWILISFLVKHVTAKVIQLRLVEACRQIYPTHNL